LKPESVSTKQERIAKLAAANPAMAFTSLNHYLDAEWLRYAYECTRKDGAVGVDGQTAQEYAADLEQNLQSLMDRLKSGRYRAPPVRRHYIDKSDGGKRALGIPTVSANYPGWQRVFGMGRSSTPVPPAQRPTFPGP